MLDSCNRQKSAHSGLCDLKKSLFVCLLDSETSRSNLEKIIFPTTAFHIAAIEVALLAARKI
ncbi:hypothetical protein AAKU67_004247 [Oxalobacteraceae bacterium GrIS 2.11]